MVRAWTTGVPDYQLAEAVERGAARVEERSSGEENDDVVRKAIQLQRNSLGFWRTLALVGDFLVKPLWLALRALQYCGGVERGGGDVWASCPVSAGHA